MRNVSHISPRCLCASKGWLDRTISACLDDSKTTSMGARLAMAVCEPVRHVSCHRALKRPVQVSYNRQVFLSLLQPRHVSARHRRRVYGLSANERGVAVVCPGHADAAKGGQCRVLACLLQRGQAGMCPPLAVRVAAPPLVGSQSVAAMLKLRASGDPEQPPFPHASRQSCHYRHNNY